MLSDGDKAVIGSHSSADLQLTDGAVSRFHCQIRSAGGRLEICDLGSRNGTRVGNLRIATAILGQSAVVRLGRTVIHFERVGREVKVPLSHSDRFGCLVGASQIMRMLFATLERAARTPSTLLITGETGTGKDAVAQSVHRASERCRGPFVVVDCGAISPNLIESELFGHERGAFTGADTSRAGAFEAANGGTLFLDEIGELDLELQPKLLRALESRVITRVGGSNEIPVNVRVIAATNRDLRTLVNEKNFRSDLFYRLAVVELSLPPLRDRLEDLPLLLQELMAGMKSSHGKVADDLVSGPYLRDLCNYAWPGNVRELRNHVERCLAFGEALPVGNGEKSSLAELGLPPIDVQSPLRQGREEWVKYFERQYLSRVLESKNGNVTAAAKAAGVDRGHFYRLLFRCGLR